MTWVLIARISRIGGSTVVALLANFNDSGFRAYFEWHCRASGAAAGSPVAGLRFRVPCTAATPAGFISVLRILLAWKCHMRIGKIM